MKFGRTFDIINVDDDDKRSVDWWELNEFVDDEHQLLPVVNWRKKKQHFERKKRKFIFLPMGIERKTGFHKDLVVYVDVMYERIVRVYAI